MIWITLSIVSTAVAAFLAGRASAFREQRRKLLRDYERLMAEDAQRAAFFVHDDKEHLAWLVERASDDESTFQ